MRGAILAVLMSLVAAGTAAGQAVSSPTASNDSAAALFQQMQDLRNALNEVRDELASSRRESQQLRQELESVRQQLETMRNGGATEEQQLLAAKVDDQYQTKVESGSKYRVRLSGLALLNLFETKGAVDSIDLPTIALPRSPIDSRGSFGASVRQSRMNLEVFGPEFHGAKTSGEMSFDFFGGFPATRDGFSSALVRLRTAKLSFDSANTSFVAGQDAPFFSPLSPTSLATASYPPLSSSGNLWTWTPQFHVERRFAVSESAKLLLQGGVLDPLTAENPAEYNRIPTAGERSRTPAYATRFAWQHAAEDGAMSIGAGAYYSRQNWGFGRTIDAWAATADWQAPIGKWFSFSGEFYRGRSIAGLGGGAAPSVLFTGPEAASTSSVFPLDSVGGWAQLKFKPVERLEFNGAFGQDQPFRSGLHALLTQHAVDGSARSRNASGFLNVIYQARSNLLFSVEYRRLWTSGFYDPRQVAHQLSLASGIVF